MALSVVAKSSSMLLAAALLVSWPGTPQGNVASPTQPTPLSHGKSLLQTASKVSQTVVEPESCSLTDGGANCAAGSKADAAPPQTLLPTSTWFFALEFLLGAVTAKFLLKFLTGKGARDLKAKLSATKVDMAVPVKGGNAAPVKTLADVARDGDAEEVRKMLKSGAKVDAEDAWGCTALHTAADRQHLSVVRVLLEHRADVNAREAWDEVPLHFAARSGCAETCELLVSHGAAVNAMNADDVTPLLAAAQANHEAVCEVLLSHEGHLGDAFDDALPPVISRLMFLRCLAPTPTRES